jgi:DNA-binding PadR family transcriptional regulator
MVIPLPDIPKLNWFELEIMYYLMGAKRYGNELRMLLNDHLGEDAVTTGKLYPILRKLERQKFIKKLKMKKSDIENVEKGMRNILTRGVERKYFEITDEGIEAVNNSIHFCSFIQYNYLMRSLHEQVRDIVSNILKPLGDEITLGILSSLSKKGIQRAIEMIPEIDNGELIFLLLGSKKELSVDLSSEFNLDVTSFPCKYDDVPLKSNYLDAAISLAHLHDLNDPVKLIKELVRTVKPGGQFILIDFARLDSLILEDILDHNLDIKQDSDYIGEDIDEMCDIMDDLVVKVHVQRVKELFIVHGRKRKRSK